ncbi:MAG: GNAT family N-acetyltransferase [Saprospiraceae bacterium]
MDHSLNNVVWNAITTDNVYLATHNEVVGVFQRDIAPFAAVKNFDEIHLNALVQYLEPGRTIALLNHEDYELNLMWKSLLELTIYQMVHSGTRPVRKLQGIELIPLNESHVPLMLALTSMMKPGPFFDRTILFGHYFGIFDGDKLVSMAGLRFATPKFKEISAVCTHPDYFGRGYARILMEHLILLIQSWGCTPFLHVKQDNVHAIEIYKKLGFDIRTPVFFKMAKAQLV